MAWWFENRRLYRNGASDRNRKHLDKQPKILWCVPWWSVSCGKDRFFENWFGTKSFFMLLTVSYSKFWRHFGIVVLTPDRLGQRDGSELSALGTLPVPPKSGARWRHA